MLILFIGHRGVGKTSLLKRIQKYREKAGLMRAHFFDLDEEISLRQKMSIGEIFSKWGEEFFRQKEEEVLFHLMDGLKGPTYIALGAGYEKKLPKEALTIWIRRETDSLGRIFLDRPRLNPHLSPLEEFFSRKKKREERYWKQSQGFQLMLREGVNWDFGEELFFTQGEVLKQNKDARRGSFLGELRSLLSGRAGELIGGNPIKGERSFQKDGILTIQPEWIKGHPLLRQFLHKIPVRFFEIRDDWFSEEPIKEWVEGGDLKPVLLSFRTQKSFLEKKSKKGLTISTTSQEEKMVLKDWALELGPLPERKDIQILSVHEGEKLEDTLESLERRGKEKILKAAPLVKNFSELSLGFQWQQKDFLKRSFLPRSQSGRWRWFRLFMKSKMPLNFFRLGGEKSAVLDQPSFCEWMNTPKETKGFGAVLGQPVNHSRSVTAQEGFFAHLKEGQMTLPFYAIDVGMEEFDEALSVLLELGLRAAAVTSPLKKKAFECSDELSPEAKKLGSVNTLFISKAKKDLKILGHNTDLEGLKRSLLEEEVLEPIAIWGGGGTLAVLDLAFQGKKKVFFSARSGQRRGGGRQEREGVFRPKTLVWACGSSFQLPSDNTWPLEKVIDLSYTENSWARQIALDKKCSYLSGLKMFKYQAEAQARFWSSCFGGEK